jgi:DNA mismatch repair protein MutS
VANVHVAAAERDGDVTFLRTVEDGATDRSYGIHVADLAGVPDPVVRRASEVLDRLRSEKAIEARGGSSDEPVQAVFDLGSGEFRAAASDGGGASGSPDGPASAGEPSGPGADGDDQSASALDPATEDVLDELSSVDVNETSPLELMQRVSEWQSRLEGDDE